MKVYISGKMTGLQTRQVEKKFQDAVNKLLIEGYIPVNPAVMEYNKGLDYEDYMHVAIAMLDVCDAIYMLKDWGDSPGARRELRYAIETGKKIMWEES